MDKTLVTGATGLVGFNIVRSLLRRGRAVRALVRSAEKAKKVLPGEVELVQADVLDKTSLDKAMENCRVVYHAAGLPEQWFRKPEIFHRVNVIGTQNIVDVAFRQGIEKLVYTSTIDIFEGIKGQKFDEGIIASTPKGTFYERSKQDAFRLVQRAGKKGLPIVSVNPAAVYGPGPAASPGINDFIKDLKYGKLPMLLPGGLPLVFSEDVGEGHVLAEENGKTGENYILGEGYYELAALAAVILKALKIEKKPPPVIPLTVVRMVAAAGGWLANISGKPPLIPKGQLHFLLWGAIPDSTKAQRELNWKPTPLTEGIARTVDFLFK